MKLTMYGTVTKHWRYMTARVRGALIEMDSAFAFYRELAQTVNRRPDNKEVFELTHENGTKLYVQFWDGRMTIGTSVEELT